MILQNFPFPCVNDNSWRSGYTSIFEIWGHYSTHYQNLIKNLNYSSKKLNEYFNEFNFGSVDKETLRYYQNSLLEEMKNQIKFEAK